MPAKRKRFRWTIAASMGLILAIGLALSITSPLFRQGLPPCQTPGSGARWLLARPGSASCNDCHVAVSWASRLQAPAPPKPWTAPEPACAAAAGLATTDPGACLACHAATPAASGASRRGRHAPGPEVTPERLVALISAER